MTRVLRVVSVCGILVCLAASCGERVDKESVDLEVPAEYCARIGWVEGMVKLVIAKKEGKELDVELLSSIVFVNVARDASFVYAGEKMMIHDEWDFLKTLYTGGHLEERLLKDPFTLDAFFANNPEEPPLVWGMSPKVIQNREQYSAFVLWLNKKLKEDTKGVEMNKGLK